MKFKLKYQLILTLLLSLVFLSCEDNKEKEKIQKAYITLQGQDKVAVIDIISGKLLKHINVDLSNVSDSPHYVVIDNTNGYWYCTLISTGMVLKFDLKSDNLVGSVTVGNMPALMALDIENQFLYVSRFMPMMGMSTESQEIHQINVQSMEVTGVVVVGADSPHGIALSSDGKTLWVASNQASHIFKIETSEFGNSSYQPQNFPLGSEVPEPIEINDGIYNALELELSHDDSKLYVSCSNTMQVRVFDTETGDSLTTIMTGMMPWHMQISEDDSKLYVTNRMGNTISKINLETDESILMEDETMNMLHGCALASGNDLLVVTSPGSGIAYIYNTISNVLLHSLSLSDGSNDNPMPTGVAISN